MRRYHVWTIGCQMNVADSQRLASELEKLGLRATEDAEQADVIVLNTCVVRQSAEDKVYGRLSSLKPVKQRRPDTVLALMGCLVGQKDPGPLRQAFPFVDVFMPPSEPAPLVEFLKAREWDSAVAEIERQQLARRWQVQDGELILPAHERGRLVAAHVPIIYGCDHVCTFCVIPYRRGRERSRPRDEIIHEVRCLVEQGVREVTLLGQIVDRYGYEQGDRSGLPRLLRDLHQIDGLERIRFLTSHPSYMTDELLDTVAELPKVMEHIEVPVQAGDDEVLRRMKRGYTVDDYRALIGRIRARVPNPAIMTDVIVGFPGETGQQFESTYRLLRELELDVAHIARFSPRPNTVAAKVMADDVPPEENERRRRALDDLMEEVVGRINARLLGQTVEVLVEDQHRGKWRGRTRTNKLVFFSDPRDWRGKLAQVKITWTGPWSMQGIVASSA
jgi:tRNA-2-methylthio-N6-dimethylallyladenosine synthase